MNGIARKLVLREIKHLKLERKLSASATLKKNDEFIVKSSLPDLEIRNERLIDRIFKKMPGYKDHIALVSKMYYINNIIKICQ